MLVTSISPFPTMFFYSSVLLSPKPFPKQALVFMCLQYKSFKNTVEKGEIAQNEQFLLCHSVFYPFKELSAIFIKLKLSSVNSVSLEESKICHFGKGEHCRLQMLSIWYYRKFCHLVKGNHKYVYTKSNLSYSRS